MFLNEVLTGIPFATITMVPADLARTLKVLPLSGDSDELLLAHDFNAQTQVILATLEFVFAKRIKLTGVPSRELKAAIDHYYGPWSDKSTIVFETVNSHVAVDNN